MPDPAKDKNNATRCVALNPAKDEKTAAGPAAVNPAKPTTLGAIIRNLCARHAEAERTGCWPEKPRWLVESRPR